MLLNEQWLDLVLGDGQRQAACDKKDGVRYAMRYKYNHRRFDSRSSVRLNPVCPELDNSIT